MLRKLIILVVCASSSASIPILYQSNPEGVLAYIQARFAGEPEKEAATGQTKPMRISTATTSVSGRKVQLEADSRGHFIADFRMNGRRIEALVDTGATAVAINLSTARKIGLSVRPGDFRDTVNTANGAARAALVTIDRMEIGRITVDKVEALVLDDKALDGTLIGMSFLNRLKKFEVKAGELTLVQ